MNVDERIVTKADLSGSLDAERAQKTALEQAASAFARPLRRVLSFVHGFGAVIADPIVDVLPTTELAGATPNGALDLGGDLGFLRMACDSMLLDMCLEGALGGTRLQPRSVARETLSVAERALVGNLLHELASSLATTLQQTTGKRVPLEPPRPNALRGHARVYQARFSVDGAGAEAGFTITATRDILECTTNGELAEPAHVNDVMTDVVPELAIGVVAELGRAKVGIRSLLSLQRGDVIRLSAATDDPISVRVGGVEKFGAVPVISRGQVSVEVQSRKAGRRR